MTRRQRQKARRENEWSRRMIDTIRKLNLDGQTPLRYGLKGRHGGRREKWPAVRMEGGKLVWARSLKAGEEFAMTMEQLQQFYRQNYFRALI